MTTPPRALVIYESMFGNTREVARAVADELAVLGLTVEVEEVGTAPPASAVDADLLVLGAPTHALSLSRPRTRADAVRQGAPEARQRTGVREWLTAARRAPAPQHLLVAAFDTRVAAARNLPGSAARKAARLAHAAHLEPVLGAESFYVDDTRGPLLPGETERARSWARGLAAEVSAPV